MGHWNEWWHRCQKYFFGNTNKNQQRQTSFAWWSTTKRERDETILEKREKRRNLHSSASISENNCLRRSPMIRRRTTSSRCMWPTTCLTWWCEKPIDMPHTSSLTTSDPWSHAPLSTNGRTLIERCLFCWDCCCTVVCCIRHVCLCIGRLMNCFIPQFHTKFCSWQHKLCSYIFTATLW